MNLDKVEKIGCVGSTLLSFFGMVFIFIGIMKDSVFIYVGSVLFLIVGFILVFWHLKSKSQKQSSAATEFKNQEEKSDNQTMDTYQEHNKDLIFSCEQLRRIILFVEGYPNVLPPGNDIAFKFFHTLNPILPNLADRLATHMHNVPFEVKHVECGQQKFSALVSDIAIKDILINKHPGAFLVLQPRDIVGPTEIVMCSFFETEKSSIIILGPENKIILK